MNIRQVLRTYSLLRQLTNDETALLETLRSLNDTERESLVVALQPEKSTAKKTSKKPSSKSLSKSARAQSLSGAIQRAGKGRVENDDKEPVYGGFADDVDMHRCRYQYPKDSPVNAGMLCDEERINGVHDTSMGYAGYHEFDAGKSVTEPEKAISA